MVMKYICNALHVLKAPLVMMLVQLAFSGVNILYKLAALDGMNLSIVVAYRFIFAAAFISPLAYFLERKSRPKLTWTILGQTFLCGLFGGTLAQNLYLESIDMTSATFASAMGNLVPAMTFILAVTFRLEKLGIRTMSGRAKVVGTILGISGAMVLTFYKGFVINLWPSNQINLIHSHGLSTSHRQHGNHILGAVMSVASSLSYAGWLIIQTKTSQNYPSPYSSTALMSLMGAIQSTIYALIIDHNWDNWKLGWNIRLITVAFSGIVGSGLMVTLLAWCVRLKGPLYVSIFSPVQLVLVAIAGSLVLDEKLHLGSVLGAVLIVAGLYAVLWAKAKEMKRINKLVPSLSAVDYPLPTEALTCVNNVDGGVNPKKEVYPTNDGKGNISVQIEEEQK